MSESFRILEGLENHLQEGKYASVATGDAKTGVLILRLSNGIEWKATVEPAEFRKSLPKEAFILGARWEFNPDGHFVKVHVPEATAAKKGKATGSLKQMPVSA